jgi:biotin carboxyl carrier protein
MSGQSKLIKDILSSYKTILENKNLILELDMVKLSDLNYSNVNHDNDGTQNDLVNKSLIDDIQTAAKSVGLTATITTAKTGHDEKTTTGNESRHANGTGVDVSIINGVGSGGATNAQNGNAQFRELGYKLKDALVSMGYVWNKESGNPKAVLWQTDTGGNHFSHLHISNNSSATSSAPSTTNTSTDTEDTTSSTGQNQILHDLVQNVTHSIGLTEEKLYGKFGDKVSSQYGIYTIPKDNNNKIKSPVSGVITSKGYKPSCNNQILIAHEINEKTFYLEYCGISKPLVKKGDSVSKGTLLGKTDSDVTVTLYDSNKNKESIDSYKEKEIESNNNNKEKKPEIKGYESGVLSSILQAPFNMFKNVKDEEGNVKEKRWASPTELEQPEPWIKKLSPTYNHLKQGKKLKEDINRIKGLLK